jgi:ABC-type transport system involved in cytochrome c biogenesis permease subunit
MAVIASLAAILLLVGFVVRLWLLLERPPLRTMGETRLWYSLFVLVAGLFTYQRWHYRPILSFSTLLSSVFLIINLLRPEIHDQTLMPALQSVWFVPHVAVYMFAYAMMGAATLFAIYLWWQSSRRKIQADEMTACDTLVKIGWAFLTLGMVMGSLWAKEAWGDYWTWDPKETWAAATWLGYLLYMHLRPHMKDHDYTFALLIFNFILLQMCWWGINFLPAAQSSVHVY